MSKQAKPHGDEIALSWGESGHTVWLLTLALCALGAALSAASIVTLHALA